MSRWGRKRSEAVQEETPAAEDAAPAETPAETPSVDAQAQPEGEATAPVGDVTEAAPETEAVAATPSETDDDAPVDPESVKQMREIDQEKAIAQAKGWHRLGRFFLEVTKPISDDEKLIVAKGQCEAMMEIDRLKQEAKAAAADFKGRIDSLQSIAIEGAKKILHGEHVENGHFPAFFDPATKERVYFDVAKDEEIKRIEARREDYQMRLAETPTDGAPAGGPPEIPQDASSGTSEPNTQGDDRAEPEQGETRTGEWRQDEVGGIQGNDGAQEEESRAS